MDFNDSFWDFINSNASANPNALRLKYHGKVMPDFDVDFAILQIECRRKFAKKLKMTLVDCPRFIFPSLLSGEQSTSDALAQYHSGLVADGSKVVDLTAGLGIDSFHFALHGSQVTAVEIDALKAEALNYNFGDKIDVVHDDCLNYLAAMQPCDAIFIDPARRSDEGARVYALTDCTPDVTQILPQLKSKARQVIIKASPMLDITATISALPGVSRVLCIGTATECKELVAVIEPDSELQISAVTITGDETMGFSFTPQTEREAIPNYANPQPGQCLIEPYPAVMKAAPFNLLCQQYGVAAIAPNTHLYLSDSMPENFPGEPWAIERIYTYESKHIKRLKKEYPEISVTTRNFDVPADTLRKKLGVKDGGKHRLFAITTLNGAKLMLITRHLT